MQAFGYIRLSKEDKASTSPARQRERIEKLCADRGWELVQVFEDIDVSAFNGKHRPAFGQMMARLSDVKAIVFWRLDRLSRSVSDFSKILDATQAAGVQLVSTDQPIDTASAMGKAFVQMTSVFAELEAGTTSERSRQMHAHKRKNGEPVGRVPFGWRREGKGYVPHSEEQAILAEAARRFVAGETFSEIARSLGMQTGPLSRMLHSQRVLEALPGKLSGSLAAALEERKSARVPTSAKSLLGGFATCAICGNTLRRSSTRGGRKSGRWSSYACPTPGHVHIAEPWLNTYVTEQVISAIDTGKLAEAMRRRKKAQTPRKVSELEARLSLLEEAYYVQGKVPASRFERLRDQLLEQLKAAQRQEREAQADIPTELAEHLAERWETLSLPTQRRIISAVLEAVTVSKAAGRGKIEPSRVRLDWRG